MKKKSMVAFMMVVTMTALSISGCGERTDIVDEDVIEREETNRTGCVEGCTCTCADCICRETASTESSAAADPTAATQAQGAEETQNTTDGMQGEESEQQPQEEANRNVVAQLTEGELAARREQQKNFADARQLLYGLPNSKDKTEKINQMDRQILANNAYDFSKRNIVFIGDSITEGVTSAIDQNGNFVSYVTYVNSYLHFNRLLNHGKGGRMFAAYGDDELSLALNFGNVTNVNSDIIVVFAGLNDYLCVPAGDKRFGDVNDKMSTSGYCGTVRLFMNQLQEYYSDRDIFFVTMYDVSKTVECTYSDVEGQLTLNDYMEVQRQLAKEYGFHVIELYDIGFMDCSSQESSDYYLQDGLHPKDNGNIVLGEHIAAELSLYFGQQEED